MAGKQPHEIPPGALANSSAPEITEQLIRGDVRLYCGLFDLSGDPAQLWRAWRTARALGEIPPACMALLAPRLDQLAKEPRNETRAEQHEQRNWILLDYYHELARMKEGRPGCATSKTEARRGVAKRHKSSEGAVKQMVMEHEGRGQRGERKKR